MKRAAELHWEGLEALGRGLLRAGIRVDGARQTRVFVTVSLEGHITDLQADDWLQAGTTGEAALDAAVRELVDERLSLMRDAAVYAQAQRQSDGRSTVRRKVRR